MAESGSSRVPIAIVALMLILVGGAVAVVAGRSASQPAAPPAQSAPSAQAVPPKPAQVPIPEQVPVPVPLPVSVPVPVSSSIAVPEPPKDDPHQALEQAITAVEAGRYTEAANRLSLLAAKHLDEAGQKKVQRCMHRTKVFAEPGFLRRCAQLLSDQLQAR